MPWNNQNGGGGWKSGGGGPWGQPPGNNNQPDLEDLLKRGQDRMKQVMGGSGVPGPLLLLLVVAALAFGVWHGFFFRVNQDERGVVTRFGAFVREEPPGLHMKLPWPIEDVEFPKATRQNSTDVGLVSGVTNPTVSGRITVPNSARDPRAESLMLTGDENIVDISFVVRWRIKPGKDPVTGESGVVQYLYNIQNPDSTVKDVAESAMREIIGKSDIQPVLTSAKQNIEQSAHKLMQEVLDNYRAGIEIIQVQLQGVDPPLEVIDAFRDVQAAEADNQRVQNEAQKYAGQVVPEARGVAERILQDAEGYRQQVIAEATGQTSRFLKIYDEYVKAPEVTRKRMFLETMERVLGGADKIILDSKSGQGVVPFLPLDQLQRKPAATGN